MYTLTPRNTLGQWCLKKALPVATTGITAVEVLPVIGIMPIVIGGTLIVSFILYMTKEPEQEITGHTFFDIIKNIFAAFLLFILAVLIIMVVL